MKRIAVSQRVDWFADRNERRDALDQAVSAWLSSAGYLPIPVPNGLAAMQTGTAGLLEWLHTLNPDALLLSGGNDLGEAPERDATEHGMLAFAESRRLPVLGICRGMQMLAHCAGAALLPCDNHVGTRHRLEGEWERSVNSFHRFAVTQCPANYRVTAFSEDGCIEAIRHVSLNWEGWMWHPEREVVFHQEDIRRLRKLFEAKA